MNLPDTSTWKPKTSHKTFFSTAFQQRCLEAEGRCLSAVRAERGTAEHGFQSGLPVEAIIRDELSAFLPTRYRALTGTVCDSNGASAGECDIVIANEVWVPLLRPRASHTSSKVIIPIEGVYGIGEVKQTLGLSELDDAMKKLTSAGRLSRPTLDPSRSSENRTNPGFGSKHPLPLYNFIIATQLAESVSLQDVIERFFQVSLTIERPALVRGLCVLGSGTLLWGKHGELGGVTAANFGEDVHDKIVPVLHTSASDYPALFPLIGDMINALNSVILQPEDVVFKYAASAQCLVPARGNIHHPAWDCGAIH